MIALLTLLIAQPAQGYELSGKSYVWQAQPVEEPFLLNVNTFPGQYLRSEVEDGYIYSLEVWNTQGRAGFELSYGGATTASAFGPPPDGVNAANYSGLATDASVALTARIWADSAPTDIVECDTQFYGSNVAGAIVYDFDTTAPAQADNYHFVWTAVHELGHCLGLSHSAEPGAVMRPTQSKGLGPDDWTLTDDDIAAVQELYGASEPELAVTAVEYTLPDTVEETPGTQFELVVRVSNEGTGTAFDVIGNLELADEFGVGHLRRLDTSASLGDIRAGESAGTAEDALRFDLLVPDECLNSYDVAFDLILSDGVGDTWTHAFDVTVDCPEPEQEVVDDLQGTWGPGCATAPGGGWLLLALTPLWLRQRRRST